MMAATSQLERARNEPSRSDDVRVALMFSEENMQHGRPWRGEDVRGWFACEKLDGCRGYWDGARMFSRSGRIPREWSRKLPRMHLDGEIFAGRSLESVPPEKATTTRRAPRSCNWNEAG